MRMVVGFFLVLVIGCWFRGFSFGGGRRVRIIGGFLFKLVLGRNRGIGFICFRGGFRVVYLSC